MQLHPCRQNLRRRRHGSCRQASAGIEERAIGLDTERPRTPATVRGRSPQITTRIAPARGTDRPKAAVAKAARWAPSPAGLSRFGADLEGVPGNARNRLAALQVPTTSIYTRTLLRLQPDPAPPSCTTAKLLTYYVRTVRRHSPCSGSTCSSSSRSSSSGQDLEASESVSPAGQVCSYWPQRGCTPTPPRPFRGRSSGSS